jgi:hypothetical protein
MTAVDRLLLDSKHAYVVLARLEEVVWSWKGLPTLLLDPQS